MGVIISINISASIVTLEFPKYDNTNNTNNCEMKVV